MRDQLFKDICDKINVGVPEILWVDMDFQQLELPDQSYPVQFPCALISFPTIPWDTLTRGWQDGVVSILVRVGVDLINDTHIAAGVTAPDREAALTALQLVNRVMAALHGMEGDYFNKITRTSSKEEKRADGLKVFNEYFETRMKDNSAAIQYQEKIAAPVVTGTIAAQIDS